MPKIPTREWLLGWFDCYENEIGELTINISDLSREELYRLYLNRRRE